MYRELGRVVLSFIERCPLFGVPCIKGSTVIVNQPAKKHKCGLMVWFGKLVLFSLQPTILNINVLPQKWYESGVIVYPPR